MNDLYAEITISKYRRQGRRVSCRVSVNGSRAKLVQGVVNVRGVVPWPKK